MIRQLVFATIFVVACVWWAIWAFMCTLNLATDIALKLWGN